MNPVKPLFLHPLFALGLLVRLVLISSLSPLAVVDWYAPFLGASTSFLSLDPWTSWLAQGGSSAAFPYGYAMWMAFLPLTVLSNLLGGGGVVLAYSVTLLISDFLLLLVLHQMLRQRVRLLLTLYWLSPIVILATYGLGLNDLIPVLLLTLGVYCVKSQKFRWAGTVCAAAISAKLSMVVAIPFFVIYLYNNRSLRLKLVEFFLGFAAAGALLFIPFIFSMGGISMLMGNEEMQKIYIFAMNLGGSSSVYLLPLLYLLMVYYAWRVKRLNFDLFQSILGLSFLMVVFMTPASPGWYVWVVPFLVFYQAMSGRLAIALTAIFTGLYVLTNIIGTPLRLSGGLVFEFINILSLSNSTDIHLRSLLLTSLVAVGVVLALRIWRESINRNDYFRLSRKPFVIGIAGDSGAGKDTFAEYLSGLFGEHSVVKLSGDDYHLWDRQKPMWKVMTHLNPMANDLEEFSKDLKALTDGRSIYLSHYDHKSGKMSKSQQIHSNDFIIVSGLHALYSPILRECYDLKVYLDIDESLRRYFKLQRDVHQRGHSQEQVLSSFLKREPEAERFIRPQVQQADLILSLQPIHSRALKELDQDQSLRLKLVVRTRYGFNELSLTRVLVGVCGLHVDIEPAAVATDVIITIEGDISAEDVALATKILCPRILEFLDIEPNWQTGVAGLMQLITLTHINQALTKRII